MRKIKKLLMTFGLAGALAVGVGASVATLNHSELIKADALVSSPYEYAFGSKSVKNAGGLTNLGGIEWNVSASTYIGGTSSKLQIGKSSDQQPVFTMTTAASNFGEEITDASVTASTAGSGSANVTLTVNGTEILNGNVAGTTLKTISKADKTPVTCAGNVVLTLNNLYNNGAPGDGKAMYLHNISISFKQGEVVIVPVSSININNTETSIYEGKYINFTAEVNSDASYQEVDWSLANESTPGVATITSTGKFTALKPGTVDVVATAQDDNKFSVSKTIEVKADGPVELHITGTPVTQYVGKATNLTGLTAKVKQASGSYIYPEFGTDVTVEPATISKDTTELTFTYGSLPSVTLPIVVSNEKTASIKSALYDKANATNDLATITVDAVTLDHSRAITDATKIATNYDEIRAYSNHDLTLKPNEGYKVAKYEFYTNSADYRKKLDNALNTWENATIELSTTNNKLVIVTVTDPTLPVVYHNKGEQVRIDEIVAFYSMEPWMEKLTNWVDTYLKFTGEGSFDETVIDKQGACKEWFASAKTALLALLAEEPTLQEKFVNIAQFDKAQERYEKWAVINGEKAYEAGTLTNVTIFDNDAAIISIVVISVLSISAIAIFAISKRRKATR